MRKRSLVVGLLAAAATAASVMGATAAMAGPSGDNSPIRPYIVGGHDATEEYSFIVSLQRAATTSAAAR